MAVTIRLARHGRKKQPFYRIVVKDKETPRDGRFIERIGTLNPLTEPATIELKEDRVKHWVSVGAKPTQVVADIFEKQIPGFYKGIEEARRAKIQAKRKARKAKK